MPSPVRRNDPCPCGSGLRYKDCHGRLEGGPSVSLDALVSRGLTAHQKGQIDEAERIYRQILARESAHPVATHYLGLVAWHRGDHAEAERLMRRAIATSPPIPDFYNNLGLLLRETSRTDEARALYRRTLEVDPGWYEAYNNLALALEDGGEWDEAIDAYRSALEREPRFAAAHQNLGRLLLALGRYAEGWDRYRWRLLAQGLQSAPPDLREARLPPDLSGRRIVLRGEQGLGDVLFFLRFAPALAATGAAVGFAGDPRLHSMLGRTGVFTLGLRGEADEPPAAQSLFVGDLPWLLGAHDPAAFPPLALAPLAERRARLERQFAPLGADPRIGLTWRAGLASVGPTRTQLKEIPIEALAEGLRGIRAVWVSVQRHPGPGEREALAERLGAPVLDHSEANGDLEEMLALQSLLDEYVGVSNLNTHLRAGVGGSMRVLVPHPPEWRWGVEGERSPWFPAMRAYRQAADGEWRAALASLRRDLAPAAR